MGYPHTSSGSPRDSRKQRGGMWARADQTHRPSARAREVQIRTLKPEAEAVSAEVKQSRDM